MDETEDRLGGRLPLLDPKGLEGSQKALYIQMRSTLVAWADANAFKGETTDGRLIAPFNPFLHSVGITPGFLQWMQADSEHTTLSKRVHEVVILTVGAVWRSPYELYCHSAVARKAGLSEAAIDALVAGGSPNDLTDTEGVAHRVARQITTERRLDTPLYEEAKNAFGYTGLVDLVYLVGMYLMTCAMLNAFEIPAPAARTMLVDS